MSFLCLGRRSGNTSSNRPDRLVGDDNLLPIALFQCSLHRLKLLSTDSHRLAALSICKLFADAQNDIQSRVDSILRLRGNNRASLSGESESDASFAVTSQSPVDTGIQKHFRRNFTRECTISLLEANILSTNSDVRSKNGLQGVQVNRRRSNNNLDDNNRTNQLKAGNRIEEPHIPQNLR